MAVVHPIGKARKSKCPLCGKPSAAETRPFCSARCKTLDLGRWLDGAYRVPTDEEPEEGDPAALQQAREDGDEET
ncbi:MAG: DNA gyrase inhibitor YacG [Alphaproteobacteria bacterium]|nr:DNA gyrase inhibitor YacG [Alphaproteobacteria bacterium]